ncbi:hypothetical protein Tco_0696658 [Tanacetum coccineum]
MSAFKVLRNSFRSSISHGYIWDDFLDYVDNKGVNERQIQTTEEKTDTSNALDALDANIRTLDKEEPNGLSICPLPPKLIDDKKIELSDQSLESENVCLQITTVPQVQKDLQNSKNCIILTYKCKQCFKIRATESIFKEKSNEAKVKNDIDVTETINIELEHSVAKLLAENEQLHKEKEHLKQTYKDLFDSIKRTRVQTKNQNDSLMEQLKQKSNGNLG